MTEKQSKINVIGVLPNENINCKPEFLNPNNKNLKKIQIVDRTEGFTAIDNRIVRGHWSTFRRGKSNIDSLAITA